MASRWLPGIRALLTVARELRSLRLAVERCADALEGHPVVRDLPDTTEPDGIRYVDAKFAAEVEQVEIRLRRTLGRDPTPEEVVDEIDDHVTPTGETL